MNDETSSLSHWFGLLLLYTNLAQPLSPHTRVLNMTKIAEIQDRSAASAWSPIRDYADVIAIGAKVGQKC